MKQFSKKPYFLYIFLIAFSAVVSFFIYSKTMPYRIDVTKGENADRTIVSPVYLEFETSEDKRKNDKLIKETTESFNHIFVISPEINDSILDSISSLYASFIDKSAPDFTYLSNTQKSFLHQQSTSNIIAIEGFTLHITNKLLKKGIKTIQVPKLKNDIYELMRQSQLSDDAKGLITTIIINNLSENLVYDKSKTREELRLAIEALPLHQTVFKEGEPIIYKGERVTATHIEVLKELNLYGPVRNTSKFIGLFVMVSLLILLIERFLYTFNFRLYRHPKNHILIYTMMGLLLVVTSLLISLNGNYPYLNLIFLIPIPLLAITLGQLLSSNISMLVGTVTVILISLMFPPTLDGFLFLFLSNCVATFATHRKHLRSELMYSGYIIGLFNLVIVLGHGLLRDVHSPTWYLVNGLLGVGNGVLSVMIALALLPYLETLFQITTSQSLLELSSLNHPLLKQLMTLAPGTYQHSIMVANLSEAAANKIKANPVVCRVGAYFHDIGKLKRPGFFTENQVAANPHDKLSPRISKMIISAHVKEGLEMAKQYKLPKVIRDIIAQHHGTSLVSFFYNQACMEEGTDAVSSDIESFRYDGPKPKFKESGILMIADSVEAASRSIEKPTLTKIEGLIDKIISDKLNDFQLEDCPLTLQELGQIKRAFLDVYKGIYHTRLDYEKELESLMNQQPS